MRSLIEELFAFFPHLLGICVPGWTVDSVCSAASPPQGYSAAVAPGPCEAPPSRGPFIASDFSPLLPAPPSYSTPSCVAFFPDSRSLYDPSAGCLKSTLRHSPRGWSSAGRSRDSPIRCFVPLIVSRATYQPLHSPLHTSTALTTLRFSSLPPFIFFPLPRDTELGKV